MTSKNQIDKSGQILSKETYNTFEELEKAESIFDDFRRQHLGPLSSTTLEIQAWLKSYGAKYYFAQRLKRKPQILRKLKRLNVRLSQLQDIGGSRVIVESNDEVDELIDFLKEKVKTQSQIEIVRITDYRDLGRDDSGYRAVHIIFKRDGQNLELQVRSRIQHYWAELIERTSVVYGFYIKELAGDQRIIDYFKLLSDIFYEIESGRKPSTQKKIRLEQLRVEAETIINNADRNKIFSSSINEGIVKTLIDKEKRSGGPDLNNWIFVFNWNEGTFTFWDIIELDSNTAIRKYVDYEKQFPSEDGFEVVLVGSSEVATVRETHSHYFGLDSSKPTLETIDESIVGFSNSMDIDIGARQILACLDRKKFWGKKTISIETLKNHYCQDTITFDSSLATLVQKGLVHPPAGSHGVALNIKKKNEIESYLQ